MTTGKKISEFTQLSDIADQDVLLTVDVSDTTSSASGTTKKALFSAFKSNITSGLNVSNWDTAYGWGNHASAGYITTETDPVFTAHPANTITTTKIGQWDSAYGWGNHAVQGYLQSIATQSINALNDVDTTGVSTNDVLKWNGTSWVPGVGGGSGSVATLNDVGNVTISSASSGQVLKWNGTAWTNQADAGGIALGDLSVTTASAGTASLSYNNTSGVFTYTPPDLSSIIAEVVDDTTPQLGGDLDLNSKNITGTGDINIAGDLKGDAVRLTNNATTPGSASTREIKVIGQLPHFYDGTDWRPFYLIDAPGQIPPDTDWDNVMFRATFDSSFDDVKYNAVPTRSSTTNTALVSSPVKVGVKSLRLDDAHIYWDVSDTSKYDFTGAWTMEAWVYIDDISGTNVPDCIFSGNSASSIKNWGLKIRKVTGTTNLTISWFNRNNDDHDTQNGTDITSLPGSAIGSWTHLAYVKEATTGVQKLYVNGSWSGTTITDNEILNPDEFGLGYQEYFGEDFDGMIDDLRISKSTRYTSNFTAPTTQLPISGSTTEIVPPQADKKGEITLGSSPTFKGSPGLTVTRQTFGSYRLTFASAYSNSTDYYVIAQGMDHSSGEPSYIGLDRTTTHVDIKVKKQGTTNPIDSGYIGIQIIHHT